MRLDLYEDGRVDDMYVHARAVSLRRTGVARYVLLAHEGGGQVAVEIWTTRRATLDIDAHRPPGWVRITSDDAGIVAVEAQACRVHFEHLERSAYILSVTRDGTDEWRAVIRARGYVKTRVLDTLKEPAS